MCRRSQVVDKLRGFRHSADPREQMVFRCMIHNLFDEYQFFHNYPDKVRCLNDTFSRSNVHQCLSRRPSRDSAAASQFVRK